MEKIMKILVLNGSPKGEHSGTLKLTESFLEGFSDAEVTTIHTIKQMVKPCTGCYSCWWRTPGVCSQKDGMEKVLEEIKKTDIIIWSFPLYCYGMPSNLKAYVDRLLPLSTPTQETDENGATYHPCREEHELKNIMISGCGFPNKEGNYEGMQFAFDKMFYASESIICVEAPMLTIPEAKPLADAYLAIVKQAGKEFSQNGKISDETHKRLDTPMMDPDEYRQMCSSI